MPKVPAVKISTPLTDMFGIDYPIILAPMFLVSNVKMMVAGAEAGILPVFPALNFRPIENYRKAIREIKSLTSKPFGVNIIVNQSNPNQHQHLEIGLEEGVSCFITSLGNPKEVIEKSKPKGVKVFCDVVDLKTALKVQSLGADGVIAVGNGAGGHAGPTSLQVLIPYLKDHLKIPVIGAGGVADGRGLLSLLSLGAAGVSVGTRFIASKEAEVADAYKEAILKSGPEDIVMTTRLSGTPCTVINTDYLKKTGLDQNILEKTLNKNKQLKKYAKMLTFYKGMKLLEKAAMGVTYKSVWCAGQSVGLIEKVDPIQKIVNDMIDQYREAKEHLP